MKKLIITFLIFFALSVSASQIIYLPKEESFFTKILRCKWNLDCYKQPLLGSTITTINATDQIKDSRAVINTNFSNLNLDKIENSTTSVAAITTLANLATVGTITSGTWSATALTVSKGGTGSTTLAANQVLLGNGTGNIGIVSGLGTSGQFLTSQGVSSAPIWTSSTFDTAINYFLTGGWFFQSASSTFSQKVGIATTSPYAPLSVTGEAAAQYFTALTTGTSNLPKTIMTNATTTSLRVGSLASTTDLIISNNCTGCLSGWQNTSTPAVAGPTAQGTDVSTDANCDTGRVLLGGGYILSGYNANVNENDVVNSYPADNDTWRVKIACRAGSCTAGTIQAYAICARQ